MAKNETDVQRSEFGLAAYDISALKRTGNAATPVSAEALGRHPEAMALAAPDSGISRELIKAMAMDAGKSLCAYLEVMFPEVWHGQNSGFKISMKHHVYNDIMALADLHDAEAIKKRLAANAVHRKELVGAYRKMRRSKPIKGGWQ